MCQLRKHHGCNSPIPECVVLNRIGSQDDDSLVGDLVSRYVDFVEPIRLLPKLIDLMGGGWHIAHGAGRIDEIASLLGPMVGLIFATIDRDSVVANQEDRGLALERSILSTPIGFSPSVQARLAIKFRDFAF